MHYLSINTTRILLLGKWNYKFAVNKLTSIGLTITALVLSNQFPPKSWPVNNVFKSNVPTDVQTGEVGTKFPAFGNGFTITVTVAVSVVQGDVPPAWHM